LKKDSAGQSRFHEELARSHFLIVPSTAECFGVVYCEASSFGVPSIARNVGGVASAVRNGRNGQRFDLEDSPAQIAAWIASVFCDFENYRQLALSSLAEFEAHLNWQVAGEKLERIIRSAAGRR
jgi:glycosyltransferase involved in cell wall biosynthesis